MRSVVDFDRILLRILPRPLPLSLPLLTVLNAICRQHPVNFVNKKTETDDIVDLETIYRHSFL